MNLFNFIEGTKDFFIQNGALGLFILAFTEASFFPIPPDIVLLPLSILAPKKALYYAIITSIASILGGVFGYYIGIRAGRPLLLRFIKEENIQKIEAMFSKYGGWAVGVAGFTPIPYKVFTIASGVFHMNFSIFVLATVLSRSARFFIEGIVVMALGERALIYINKFLGPGSFIIAGVAVIFYLIFKKAEISIKIQLGKGSPIHYLKAKLQRLLSLYGEFGIYLLAGFSTAATLGTLFFKLATEVLEKELDGFDHSIINFMANVQVPFANFMVSIINYMQNPYIFVGLLFICLLFVRLMYKELKYCSMTLITFIGSFTLQSSFKSLYQRPRISSGFTAMTFMEYSFPSGFISVITGLSGYVVFLIFRELKIKQRYIFIFLWFFFLGMVGFSRVYAGISYPSDVIAGLLLGGVWLSVCIVATKALECYKDR